MAYCRQLAVGGVATLATVTAGMTLGFSAVTLPAMQTLDRISEAQASWIASLSTVATPLGCLLTGLLLDWLGRRSTLLLLNVPAVLGWILIATAPHGEWLLYQVYAGRLLTGFATGMSSSPATVYVSEVVDKSLRGMMVTWSSVGISLGILAVYVIGSVLPHNWRLVAGITACFPVASLVAVWFLVPESPAWLVSRGRTQEAEASMRLIRSVPQDSRLSDSLQQQLDGETRQDGGSAGGWKDTLCFLSRPEAYKPLLIMNAFFFFQQFSGIFVVVFYAVRIVHETGAQFDRYLATVLIGLSRVVTTVAISFASRRCGRRALCSVSGLGMTLSIWALALYLTLVADGLVGRGTYGWWPITALVGYILTSTVGFLTLPWAMIGEVFPARIRGPACGVTTCLAYLFSFVAVKLYPAMKQVWGNHGLFTFYCAMALAGTACMHACLPETRDRSLADIEDHFRGKRRPAEGSLA